MAAITAWQSQRGRDQRKPRRSKTSDGMWVHRCHRHLTAVVTGALRRDVLAKRADMSKTEKTSILQSELI
jgi:hypothetical protein